MTQTRDLLSLRPDGTGVVFRQELRESGWYNLSARTATHDDFQMTPSQNEQPATLGRSGSSNAHARLSPSDGERWSSCTASIAAEQSAADEIFKLDYASVRALVPYLLTFPDELHDHEKRAIEIVRKVESGKLKLDKLTPEQRADIKKSEGNENSREGTRAHDFAEAILNGRRTLDSIPEEFRVNVGGYVEYVEGLKEPGAEVLVEYKVPLFYAPDSTGTLDWGSISDEVVKICDLKFGRGKLVKMRDNRQLAIYALSLVRDAEESGRYFFEPDTRIEIHVYQPRHHEAASLKPWIMTLADLEAFCKEIGEAAAHVMSGEGLVFAPNDETCYWCKLRKVGCKAYADAQVGFLDMPQFNMTAEELLEGLPDEDDLAELDGVKPAAIKKLPVGERLRDRCEFATNGKVALLPDEILIMLCERGDAIKGMIDDAWAYLEGRVLSGEKLKGLGVSWGREGNRAWVNEEAADNFLKNQGLKQDERYSFKLLGPAAIEKIPAIAAKLDEKTGVARTRTRFKELISRSPARKVMVIDDGSRELITSDIDELPDDPEEPSATDVLEECG